MSLSACFGRGTLGDWPLRSLIETRWHESPPDGHEAQVEVGTSRLVRSPYIVLQGRQRKTSAGGFSSSSRLVLTPCAAMIVTHGFGAKSYAAE